MGEGAQARASLRQGAACEGLGGEAHADDKGVDEHAHHRLEVGVVSPRDVGPDEEVVSAARAAQEQP